MATSPYDGGNKTESACLTRLLLWWIRPIEYPNEGSDKDVDHLVPLLDKSTKPAALNAPGCMMVSLGRLYFCWM